MNAAKHHSQSHSRRKAKTCGAVMTSLQKECGKVRRCHSFSPSPILPPSERAKSWRDIYRPAGHKTRNDFYAKRARGKARLRTYPAAALSRYAAKKDTRNNFAFGISSKLVYRQAEQKARHGIPKIVQARGNIFTPQTITSRRFFKHDLYSDERSPTKKAFPLCKNKGSKHDKCT